MDNRGSDHISSENETLGTLTQLAFIANDLAKHLKGTPHKVLSPTASKPSHCRP